MPPTFAFDLYGTLIDIASIAAAIRRHVGPGRAEAISDTWRQRQLEYSFRRGLMKDYVPFSEVTADAFRDTLAVHKIALSPSAIDDILGEYRALAAFSDAAPALSQLETMGARLSVFSNGDAHDISDLLRRNHLDELIEKVVSAQTISAYKPDPAVYGHFADTVGSRCDETWLVSSTPLDLIGASNVGWKTIWVRRRPDAVFDGWGPEPTVTVKTLTDIADALDIRSEQQV